MRLKLTLVYHYDVKHSMVSTYLRDWWQIAVQYCPETA